MIARRTFLRGSAVLPIAVNGTTISVLLGNGLKSNGSAIVVDPAVVARKFTATITGDGTTTSFPFNHGLGTAACHVTVRDSSGNQVLVDNTTTSTTVTIAFGTAPASNVTYTVLANALQFLFGATTPLRNGTAAVGSSPQASRADHVHPSDTSRLAGLRAPVGGLVHG